MKNILLSLIVLLLLTSNTYSQQAFKTYLPKEGLNTAINQVKTDGLKEPQLMFLATTSQKFEQMPPLLQPTVDLNTGKASMWMYQFRDKAIDTLSKMVLVLKISVAGFDQFMPISLPMDFGEGELPLMTSTLEGKKWLQTDSVFASIRRDKIYKTFAQSNSQHFVLASFLGVSDETPGMEPDTPYWMTIIASDTSETSMDTPLTCITNAVSNETICIDINSVSDKNVQFRIFPNPTSNQFFIELEKQSLLPVSISIINLSGVEVMNFKQVDPNGIIPLNISNLPSGEYLIWIHNQEINSLGKILKQ